MMKKITFIIVIALVCQILIFSGCSQSSFQGGNDENKTDNSISDNSDQNTENGDGVTTSKNTYMQIELKNSGKTFDAQLYDNATVNALLQLLPLSLTFSDMPHEKYAYLPERLPTSPENIRRINAGDFMLWGSNCIVIFYESFDTSYSYTKIGKISDVTNISQYFTSGSMEINLTAHSA